MNVFFYCEGGQNPNISHHDYICLAEGFTALGAKCYGDRNMYKPSIGQDYLIKYDEHFLSEDADIVIFHFMLYHKSERYAEKLIEREVNRLKRKYVTVFIDASDGLITPGFRKEVRSCDIVLKCHYNKKYKYPANFFPWQFGVSTRMLNAIDPLPFEDRDNSMLVNFRVKHQLRDYVNAILRPVAERYMIWDTRLDNFTNEGLAGDDLLLWEQTGARHYPSYYAKLSRTKACACYGGVFALPWGNQNKYLAKVVRDINDILFKVVQWDRVRQWDSWRFWESFTAGACVFHIDLEKYGCVLPVMLKNGEHYIGIDISDIGSVERQFAQNRLADIAEQGRMFILDNYTPKPVVLRLLNLVESKKAGEKFM